MAGVDTPIVPSRPLGTRPVVQAAAGDIGHCDARADGRDSSVRATGTALISVRAITHPCPESAIGLQR